MQTETFLPNSNFDFLPKYDLTGECAGLGLILVNHKCGILDRIGASKDLQNFTHIFKNMKLKLSIQEDFKDPKSVLKFIGEEVKIHQNLKSFFIAISTHGLDNDTIDCHDGKSMGLSDILSEFQIPILAGKPKVFLIQACRGDSEDTKVCQRIVADFAPTIATHESDVLKAYSCVKGYTSTREREVGSWFVAALRACFDELQRPCNILQLLTATNNYMQTQFEDRNKLGGVVKQPCEVTYTLCADLIV